MVKIAIVLVHNLTDQKNQAQIELFKPLIQKQTVINDEFDESGNVVGTFETYYYTLSVLPFEHEVRFYQVFPFGVTPPPNKDDIDSHKVFYGKGDEDKTGDHPRFFNWGLKRGTDYGADIAVCVSDYSKVNWQRLLPKLQDITDPTTLIEFIDDTSVKVGSLKLLKEVGQLKEDRTLSQAFTDLKTRVTEKGYSNG